MIKNLSIDKGFFSNDYIGWAGRKLNLIREEGGGNIIQLGGEGGGLMNNLIGGGRNKFDQGGSLILLGVWQSRKNERFPGAECKKGFRSTPRI